MTSRSGPLVALLLSGSTRTRSTNTAALRTVHELADARVRTVLYDGLAALPAFDPDLDAAADGEPSRLPPVVVELRALLADADVVVLCTPEYAGTLPGSLKNLLDWTVGGGEMDGKAVTWLKVAAPGRGEGALDTLRTVLRYVGADVLEAAAGEVFVGRDDVDDDGRLPRQALRDEIAQFLAGVADAVDARRGGPAAGPASP